MAPMGLIFTRFISFKEIATEDIDLYEDAWGLNSEFTDVIQFLEKADIVPDKKLTNRMMVEIRKRSE
jgi:hypothetical protein